MDVIVASATPWGHSALAVVRLSGLDLKEVLGRFVRPYSGFPLPHAQSRRVDLYDGQGTFDDGLITFSQGPNSYTGEDTAEISCHGNPQIVERLLAAAVAGGARLAHPGEFTRRAVQHGKMDLIRAEAVMQVATATTKRGLDIGRQGLEGHLSKTMSRLRSRMIEVAAECEARLDYPADELAVETDQRVLDDVADMAEQCRVWAGTYRAGQIFVQGARVALVGPVNAGKSSLFNVLLGKKRALVHNTPGTTRDVLEVPAVIHDVAVTLLDTAGERKTHDPVEAAGLALAQELVEQADALIVVLRAEDTELTTVEQEILARTAHIQRVVVYNGIDRLSQDNTPKGAIPTSTKSGEGIDALKVALQSVLVGEDLGESATVIASVRQRDQLERIAEVLDQAKEAFTIAGVAVTAALITDAIAELDTLTGEDTRENILDAMFSKFCIGK